MTTNDKKFKYTFDLKKAVSEDKTYIYGSCSTTDVDRDGDSVDIESLDLAFQRFLSLNPVLLYNHDLDRVIGKVLPEYTGESTYRSGIVDNKLNIVAVLSDTAGDIKTQIDEGSLKSLSIGGSGRVMADGKLTITDLYEISCVTVGSNPNALFSVVKSICIDCDKIKGDEEFMVNEIEMEMIVEKAVKAVQAAQTEEQEVDVIKGLQETIVALKEEIDSMQPKTVQKGIVETETVQAASTAVDSIMNKFYMED